MDVKKQSNPFSTGGGGTNFETEIQTAFVALMLTKTPAPSLPSWPIEKIKLQGKYDGYETDDFIAVAKHPQTGNESKLLAQIKHTIAITKNDETFGEVIAAAWADFQNSAIFNPESDSIALITGPLSATDIANVRPLLEWARHSEDSANFLKKVNTPGFGSEAKKTKLEAFREQLQKANEGNEISDDEFWRFMKCFHLLPYDLDVDSGVTFPLLLAMLNELANGDPEALWAKLVLEVRSANQNAGTLLPESLATKLDIELLPNINGQWFKDNEKLKIHGDYIFDGIKSDIGGITVKRNDAISELQSVCEEANFIFIEGERGCGKSSLVRQFVNTFDEITPVYCLRAEDLDQPHLDAVFTSIGIKGSLRDLEAGLALMPRRFLVIESLEKLLELRYTTAFTDLLGLLKKQTGWTIIASGRDYAHQQIVSNFLVPHGIRFKSLKLSGFTDEEVDSLCDKLEPMQQFRANTKLKPLLRNPFMADLAFRASSAGSRLTSEDGEQAFRSMVWRDVISKESCRQNGLPLKRKRAFMDISVRRAKNMTYGVSIDGLDPDALMALEDDHLIRRDIDNATASPAHDVLEDWALEKFIDEAYRKTSGSFDDFFADVGSEPAMNRAFRMWLAYKFKFDDSIWEFISNLLVNNTSAGLWKDEAISVLLLGENPYESLVKLKETLFANEGELLKRFCFILRISAKIPQNRTRELSGENKMTLPQFFMPYGNGWDAVIKFIYENKESLDVGFYSHIVAVLDEWSYVISVDSKASNSMRTAGLLGLHMLQFAESGHRDGGRLKKLVSVIIKASASIKEELIHLFQSAVLSHEEDRDRPDYVEALLNLSLTNPISVYLCKHLPQLVVDVAWKIWIFDRCPLPTHGYHIFGSPHKDVEESFGVHEHRAGADLSPASGAKGPFRSLLLFHPVIGLDLILRLCNFSAESYALSELDKPTEFDNLFPSNDTFNTATEIKTKIQLPNGDVVSQYCTQRLWAGYRGHTVMPGLIQSALMTLENWLIAVVEQCGDLDYLNSIFIHILKNSNSVMTTSILASVATGFPDKFGKSALPILGVPEFYNQDLTRSIQEMSGREINWFGGLLNRDPYSDLYAEERRKAALRPWRKESLETLIAKLQFTELREEVVKIIDQLKVLVGDDEQWKFRFLRIDTRGWKAEEDKENNRVLLGPGEIDPELKEKQDKTQAKFAQSSRFMALSLWAGSELKHETYENSSYSDWTEALTEAKELLSIINTGNTCDLDWMQSGGIFKAASIFLRDHSSELKEDDLDWVIEMVCGVVLQGADANIHSPDATDVTDHSGAAAAALVLPIIFDYVKTEEDRSAVKRIIATALTHINTNVREATATGIRDYLWQRDSVFAQNCFNGAIEYAKKVVAERKKEQEKYRMQFSKETLASDTDASEENWKIAFRERIASENIVSFDMSFDFKTHCSWNMLAPCLIPPNGSTDSVQIAFISRMIQLCEEIEIDDDKSKRNIDDKLLPGLTRRLAELVFFSPDEVKATLLDQLRESTQKAPDLVHWFLISYLHIADINKKIESYWDVWSIFADDMGEICAKHEPTKWHSYREPNFDDLIRGFLFYDIGWQRVQPEEFLIIPGVEKISEFIKSHGSNHLVFEAYCHFLFYFPHLFVPEGLKILSEQQRNIGGSILFLGTNTVFYLETVLQRYLLDSGEASIPAEMHSACKVLLDALVEQASSNAYFLRERLIHSVRKL